jgi:hypothetical protein
VGEYALNFISYNYKAVKKTNGFGCLQAPEREAVAKAKKEGYAVQLAQKHNSTVCKATFSFQSGLFNLLIHISRHCKQMNFVLQFHPM